MKEKKDGLLKQFIRFGTVGVINTALSLIIYWVCIWGGLHYFFANAIGFVITVAISYILNNCFTFHETGKKVIWSISILLKVYASYIFTGLVINSFLLWIWNDCVGINRNIAPIINLFITVPLNFIINKNWAYRKSVE